MTETQPVTSKNLPIGCASMNIRSFGLHTAFPDFLVPEEAIAFMREIRGRSLKDAIDAGNARGLLPFATPLPQVGGWVYGFGIVMNGQVVPFVVELSEFPAGNA